MFSWYLTSRGEALRPVMREGRLSIDFHNVLDVGVAADRGVGTIQHLNRPPLERFTEAVSQLGFRVGVCSYLGESGRNSSERRTTLLAAVCEFNTGKDRDKRLGVRIVGRALEKSRLLRESGFCIHVDDRSDIC